AKPGLGLVRALPVRAMAHITGGGITENLPRVLPERCRAVIHPSTWPLPPIFRVLQDAGRVEEAEMRRTFNMGIGYGLVVRPEDAAPTSEAPASRCWRSGRSRWGRAGCAMPERARLRVGVLASGRGSNFRALV